MWCSSRTCAACRRAGSISWWRACGLRISRSEVSRIAGLLDEQVTAFRERPLEGRYLWTSLNPWPWLSATISGRLLRVRKDA